MIRLAQQGDRDCVSLVAGWSREQVLPHLYRVGLDYHLAQDLCQETMMRLLQYLPRLKLADENALRAWLYRTAYSRLQQHGRERSYLKAGGATVHHTDLTEEAAVDARETADTVAHTEISVAVRRAMETLKLSYRRILTLRCFDQLSYAQIADITGGSQLQAKLCFFRAKQSLKKQLLREGITRGSLLPALGAFAAVTACSSEKAAAATTLTGSSMKVGWTAALIGGLSTKLGLAVTATVVAGAIAAHSSVPSILPDRTVREAHRGLSPDIVRSIHARVQGQAAHFDFINVGIVYDANVIMTASYGPRRNIDAALPLLGVNPITSTVCLCLLEQGVIHSLDDSIASYSKRFADCVPSRFQDSPVTFRHLLNHTSGLPGQSSYAVEPIWRAGKLNLKTRPGSERTSSAAGYAVLETLMEDITQHSFDDLVQEFIANPIGATSLHALEPADANVAGVLCNVTDLTGFMAALLRGRLVPGDQLRHLVLSGQGLGWRLLVSPDGEFAHMATTSFHWDRHDVIMQLQPCGRLGAVVFLQWPRDRHVYFNELQFTMDLITLIGEQHVQDRGGPHQPTWDIL